MSTISELSKVYAQRILDSIKKDGFQTHIRITSSMVRDSTTLRELKIIKNDIDDLQYTNTTNKISESDKQEIYKNIQSHLDIPFSKSFSERIYEASNDEITNLVDLIDRILKGN